METTIEKDQETAKGKGLFAAFWRWHFFASIIVIPVFVILSVTGMAWMFRYDIWNIQHPGVIYNSISIPANTQFLSLDEQAVIALKEFPDGSVTSIAEPFGNRNTRVFVQDPSGVTHDVYVNPQTGKVTGIINTSSHWTDLMIRLHGNLTLGTWGDVVLELAACWAIVMALTGYYMYFRNRKGKIRYSKTSETKNRHALIGFVAGFGILFLVVSGLPWTKFWGETVQSFAAGKGLQITLWGEDPGAKSDFGAALQSATGASQRAPWTLGESSIPNSQSDGAKSISVDGAVSVASQAGLTHPYLIVMPDGKDGVYSVMADSWQDPNDPASKDVSKEAVVHVDQYSGAIAATYGYDQYSTTAKLVNQGISIHEGRKLGVVSKITTTLFCLAILFLCITGPMMWWKRRPKAGGLAAPKGRVPITEYPMLAITLIIMGVVLPLFGASLLLLLILDKLLFRRFKFFKEALGVK